MKSKAAKIVRTVAIGFGVLVAGILVAASTRPDTFHVERSTVIAAAPEFAYAQVEDFHAWRRWSPYENLDADMTRTFEGADKGVGARYGWSGKQAGEGKMTIERVEKNARVGVKLEFKKPMEATNQATFTFAPEGSGTKVTWALDGPNSFLGKTMSLFVDVDKFVGGDFERGLASLKTEAERDAKAAASR